jgi:dephospho-CoA kinase
MPILGITGGIASGKSTFRNLLLQYLRADFFDADAAVGELLEKDQIVREEIIEKIHRDAYGSEGKPDRALLRELVFREVVKKRALEAILHPLVRERWLREAQEASNAGRMFVVDIPLLFETDADALFDRIITVGCTVETQLVRLNQRSGLAREISQKIIASQMPIGVKISRSHHVIWNDGALEALVAQTALISRYLHDRYG